MRASWERRQTDFIGRFDLLWDGEGEPKLAEYNADTPTVLVEAAAAQRDWVRAVHPDKGQFNVLEESLEAGWRAIGAELIARHRERDPASLSKPLQLVVAAQGVKDKTKVAAPEAGAVEASGVFGGPAPSIRHSFGLGFMELGFMEFSNPRLADQAE